MTQELTLFTTRVYLSVVTLMHKIASFSDPTRHNYLLKLVLKGAKRIHSFQPTRKREPIRTTFSQVTLPDPAYTITSKERFAYPGIYIPQIVGQLCLFAAMVTYLTEQGQTMQAAPLLMFTKLMVNYLQETLASNISTMPSNELVMIPRTLTHIIFV